MAIPEREENLVRYFPRTAYRSSFRQYYERLLYAEASESFLKELKSHTWSHACDLLTLSNMIGGESLVGSDFHCNLADPVLTSRQYAMFLRSKILDQLVYADSRQFSDRGSSLFVWGENDEVPHAKEVINEQISYEMRVKVFADILYSLELHILRQNDGDSFTDVLSPEQIAKLKFLEENDIGSGDLEEYYSWRKERYNEGKESIILDPYCAEMGLVGYFHFMLEKVNMQMSARRDQKNKKEYVEQTVERLIKTLSTVTTTRGDWLIHIKRVLTQKWDYSYSVLLTIVQNLLFYTLSTSQSKPNSLEFEGEHHESIYVHGGWRNIPVILHIDLDSYLERKSKLIIPITQRDPRQVLGFSDIEICDVCRIDILISEKNIDEKLLIFLKSLVHEHDIGVTYLGEPEGTVPSKKKPDACQLNYTRPIVHDNSNGKDHLEQERFNTYMLWRYLSWRKYATLLQDDDTLIENDLLRIVFGDHEHYPFKKHPTEPKSHKLPHWQNVYGI
jgi:hypothetical protein